MDNKAFFLGYALALALVVKLVVPTLAFLFPRESETREVVSLDGLWNFVKSDPGTEYPKWYLDDLSKGRKTILMPVPASYNDVTTDRNLRDYAGPVWYDRKFFIPEEWSENTRVWIHFGSVHYEAHVYINGQYLTQHKIGNLPIEAEIKTSMLNYGKENRVTVYCNSVLLPDSIPQGFPDVDDTGKIEQHYTFDFFNYGGIHRSVYFYTTPVRYIKDIQVITDISEYNTGVVSYKVVTEGIEVKGPLILNVQLVDKNGIVVANATNKFKFEGVLPVEEKYFKPWWPYLMDPDPGYLYQLEVFLYGDNNFLYDIYRLPVGIRTLKWNNKQFMINNKPVYFRGVGKHEDSDVRGKGLDLAVLTRDFNLLKWIGANSYRTSHYPYSEESMQFADENGIMIIDECSSVDTDSYSDSLLKNHKSALYQLIKRDQHHPSVVMWSIANEPRTKSEKADLYFQHIANYTKELDSTRPITASIAVTVNNDKVAQHLDIISFNRYNAWYSNAGRLDKITMNVINEAKAWHQKHNKPIIMSEYGADTLEGLHTLPAFIWSEEYQSELLSEHFKAFDKLRKNSWFLGEFVWNFADFKTAQGYTRVNGNKKGVFTRNRQPKTGAYILRRRYMALSNELDKTKIPKDLYEYTAEN